MLLSIIVPVYNVADYLQTCADSIYANDLTDCEVILVDDGSTDGKSGALCDEIAKGKKNTRVIHQANGGLGAARNTGIEAANGEYLFFVDSDDTIAADAVAVLRNAISEKPAEIYSFPIYTHDGIHPPRYLQTNSFLCDHAFDLRQQPNFLLSLPAAWARIYRRNLFLRSGIRYPGRVWYEDIRTTPKLFALADSIVTLEQPLYYYLARTGSIMRSGNVARCVEIMDAFDDLRQWFTQQGLLEEYNKQLSCLAVEHILVAASVRAARVDAKHPMLADFRAYMEKNFPDYAANPLLAILPRSSRLCLRLIRGGHYRLMASLFALKDKLHHAS